MELYKKEFLEYLDFNDYDGKVIKKPHVAIHARCGDMYMTDVNCKTDSRLNPIHVVPRIQKMIAENSYYNEYTNERCSNTRVYTDNYFIRNALGSHCSDLKIVHTALGPGKDPTDFWSYYETVVEFYSMMNATKIYAFSKSGFSFWAAFFGSVPIYLVTDKGTEELLYENL